MIAKLRKFTIEHHILATAILIVMIELIFRIEIFELIIPDKWELGGTLDRVIYSVIWMLFIVYFMKNSLKSVGYSTDSLKYGLKEGLWVVLIPLMIHVFELLPGIISGTRHFISTTDEILTLVDALLMYISVGLFEETAYRAIPINVLRNKDGLDDRKQMYYCLIISSVFFGLSHLGNMISGFDTPIQAVGRSIQAIGAGMIFGAIYWKSGSLLSAIIIHTLWDATSVISECLFIEDSAVEAQAVTEAASEMASEAATTEWISLLIQMVVIMVINVLIALYIVRKKGYEGCKIKAVTMREQFLSNDAER